MSKSEISGGASQASLDLTVAATSLASSSTATRIEYLQSIQDALRSECECPIKLLQTRAGLFLLTGCPIALDQPAISRVIQLLLATISYYADRESRLAVQRCLTTILKGKPETKLLGSLVQFLRREAQKSAIAASTSFVIVEWCTLLIQSLAGTEAWSQFGRDVLLCDADAFERCRHPSSKRTIAHSATVLARRGFRKLFGLAEDPKHALIDAVKTLTDKGNTSVATNAPLLGVIAGVASRNDSLKPVLEAQKPLFYDFYNREVVGSKTTVSEHIAVGLRDFFCDFATLEEIEKEIVPPLEKGLLRSPEVILAGVLRPLVLSLPGHFDLSGILKARLLKPLLSSIKSSNPEIRTGAVAAFEALASRSRDEQRVVDIVDELLAPLKAGKLASADQKILYTEMLNGIDLPVASAEEVSKVIAGVAAKEGNEPALDAETKTLSRTCRQVLSHHREVPKPVLETMAKGLSEKKIGNRKLWLLMVAQVLYKVEVQDDSAATQSFLDTAVPKLVNSCNEVIANPSAAVQNGLIVAAYIVTALAPSLNQQSPSSQSSQLLLKSSAAKDGLAPGGNQAFLLNPRIYTKLSTEEELHWFSLCLFSLWTRLGRADGGDALVAWPEAIIFLITSPDVPRVVHEQTVRNLSCLYRKDPELVAKAIIEGLWNILLHNTKEKELKCQPDNLIDVLKAICLEASEEPGEQGSPDQKEAQACSLLVLARPELIPRSSWITLCLRMGIDPGELAQKHQGSLLKEIGKRASTANVSCP